MPVTNPETIHPALWRASQLARGSGRTVAAGEETLAGELPGGGWPLGTLVELLVQQPGVGELRLLPDALLALGEKPIALLSPPHPPQALALGNWGIPAERLLWLRPQRTADLLWAAEQLLRAGTCGAVLCWQQHVRGESLRRVHLAAQTSETLFCLVRPSACARDSSPAPLARKLRHLPSEKAPLSEQGDILACCAARFAVSTDPALCACLLVRSAAPPMYDPYFLDAEPTDSWTADLSALQALAMTAAVLRRAIRFQGGCLY